MITADVTTAAAAAIVALVRGSGVGGLVDGCGCEDGGGDGPGGTDRAQHEAPPPLRDAPLHGPRVAPSGGRGHGHGREAAVQHLWRRLRGGRRS